MIKKLLMIAGFCGWLVPAASFAEDGYVGGYDGLIEGIRDAPGGGYADPGPQDLYEYVSDAGDPKSALERQRLQREKATALEQETARAASEEQMEKAMEDARKKQDTLQEHAQKLEQESDAGFASGEDWSLQQQEEYQKSLMDMTRRQQELEEQARQEMERNR